MTKSICSTCKADISNMGGLKQCTNCWEVEKRIDSYLKSAAGFLLVEKKIRAIQRENERELVNDAMEGWGTT